MTEVAAIAEILSKLGFSFWQLVVLTVALIFRSEAKLLVQRVSKLKMAGGEIELEREGYQISDLIDLQSDIIEKNMRTDQVKTEIQDKIHKRTIGALVNIKKNTSFLWDHAFKDNRDSARAQIRRNTLRRVLVDMDLLTELGLIRFVKDKAYEAFDGDIVYEVEVQVTSPDLVALVEEASGY